MKRLLWSLAASAALLTAQDKPASPISANVELTVYLLTGTSTPQQTADDVPQDLAATVKQLRGPFNYKNYKLTESFVIVGRSEMTPSCSGGGSRTGGVLPGSPNYRYSFTYRCVRVSSETPRVFHISNLTFTVTKPVVRSTDLKTERADPLAEIYTDLDIREGQKTVVGKSSVYSNGDALFLIIVPKVVE